MVSFPGVGTYDGGGRNRALDRNGAKTDVLRSSVLLLSILHMYIQHRRRSQYHGSRHIFIFRCRITRGNQIAVPSLAASGATTSLSRLALAFFDRRERRASSVASLEWIDPCTSEHVFLVFQKRKGIVRWHDTMSHRKIHEDCGQ